MSIDARIPDALIAKGLKVQKDGNDFIYDSAVQGVRFRLRIITRKDHFKTAFETSGVHLIYDGHARYGRGPCFGNVDSTYARQNKTERHSMGEQWENGANPPADGIFRMGFPFNGVPISEIVNHGYTPSLVPTSVTISANDCDPDLRVSVEKRLLKSHTTTSLGAQSIPGAKGSFWGYNRGGKLHLVIRAGWTKTATSPMDLGATTPQSRVFCHFGCSSLRHNQPILRQKQWKGWRQSGDTAYAYFTTNSSYEWTAPIWLYHLFTYPVYNAFLPWGPSLAYTVAQTNIALTVKNRDEKVDNYQIK